MLKGASTLPPRGGFSKVELGVRRFAPELGQDNFHVLRDILGVPEDDIRAMEREGVIKRTVTPGGAG